MPIGCLRGARRYINCSITTAANMEECTPMEGGAHGGAEDAVYSSLADDVMYVALSRHAHARVCVNDGVCVCACAV